MSSKAQLTLLSLLLACLGGFAAPRAFAQEPPSPEGSYVIGLADAEATEPLNKLIGSHEDYFDCIPRVLILAGGKDGFAERAQGIWSAWSQLRGGEFKAQQALVLILEPESRGMEVYQGAVARSQGVLSSTAFEQLRAEHWAKGDDWMLSLKSFVEALCKSVLRARQERDLALKQANNERADRHRRIGDLLKRLEQRLFEVDDALGALRRDAPSFQPPTGGGVEQAQVLLAKARAELEFDGGAAEDFAIEAQGLLDEVARAVSSWRTDEMNVQERAAELSAELKSVTNRPADAVKALLERVEQVAASRDKPDQRRLELEAITATLAQLKPLATPDPGKDPNDPIKPGETPPSQAGPDAPKPGDSQPGDSKPLNPSPNDRPPPPGADGGAGGWLIVIVFALITAGAVILVQGPDEFEDEVDAIPDRLARVEALLESQSQELKLARERLNSHLYPKPLKVPQVLAALVTNEPGDADENGLVSLPVATLYRGSAERRVRRARSRYAEMMRQHLTLESSVAECRRWVGLNQSILALRAIGRAARVRDLAPLAENLDSTLAEIDAASATVIEQLPPMVELTKELEASLDGLVAKGLAPSAVVQPLNEVLEGQRAIAQTLLTDPIHAQQSLLRLKELQDQLKLRYERIDAAQKIFDGLKPRLQEALSGSFAPTPYEKSRCVAVAAEAVRGVGAALNCGHIDVALDKLDKADEQLENRERVDAVRAEAETTLAKEIEARKAELDSLRDRIAAGREGLSDLSERHDPRSFYDIAEFPGIVEMWCTRFEDVISEAEALKSDGLYLEARLLVYYLGEKLADIGGLLDQIAKKRFAVGSDRDSALSLYEKLKDQDQKLRDYFEREKVAVRGYARNLLALSEDFFKTIQLPDEGKTADWPQLLARVNECAQLYDLARNAAEDDVSLQRRAWSLQSGVARNMQIFEDEVDEAERKGIPPNIARLSKIRFDTLSKRFQRLRQHPMSDDSSRWQCVSQALEGQLRYLMALVQPVGKVRDSETYVQSVIDQILNRIHRLSFEDPEQVPETAGLVAALKQAQELLKGGQFERAMEQTCQVEDQVEAAWEQLNARSLADRDKRRIALFDLIRTLELRRETLNRESRERASERQNQWFRSEPGDLPWSLQTTWVRGLPLGLLDALPVTGAPSGDQDILMTRKLDGGLAQGDPFAAAAGGDPFASVAGGDPFASVAAISGDPFAAFAGAGMGGMNAFSSSVLAPDTELESEVVEVDPEDFAEETDETRFISAKDRASMVAEADAEVASEEPFVEVEPESAVVVAHESSPTPELAVASTPGSASTPQVAPQIAAKGESALAPVDVRAEDPGRAASEADAKSVPADSAAVESVSVAANEGESTSPAEQAPSAVEVLGVEPQPPEVAVDSAAHETAESSEKPD